MPAKNTDNSSYLTKAVRGRSMRSTVRAQAPVHFWLACAAGLALCLAGCPTQEPAESLLEQDTIDAPVESEPPTPPQDPPAGSDPPVDPPDEDNPAQPAISAIQPLQGPAGGGTRVTIQGTALSSATGVLFGDVPASNLTVVSDETITAMTPAHAEEVVQVSIELADGLVLSGPHDFAFVDAMCPNYDPAIDTDGDGLADGLEACGWRIAVDLYGFGTDNPSGLYYARVVSDPMEPDTDFDGLSDYDEYLIGSDPRDPDTDNDGLNDAEEVYRWLTSPVSVDSDGDANGDNDALPPNASLFDGAELKIDFDNDPNHTPAIDATSPIMDDTDGDGRSDYEELDHTVLSPVIADLPALELEVVDEIDVLLNVEYAEEAGTSTEYGTSFSRATTNSQHWYTGGTLQVGMGTSVTVGAEASAGFPSGASAKAKAEATVSMNVSYSQEWQVGGEQSEELRNESSRLEAKSRTHTETISSGALSTGIVLTNPGPVSYCLTDLGMTVRLFERGVDPDDPLYVGSFKTVATLVPVLGEDGFTLAPGQSTPVLRVQAENVNVDRIRDFLRDPHALHLEQAYFEMETEEGLNYGFIEEATQASTATLMIDFGDGEWHKYRFATNVNRDANGSATGVRLADALDLLGVEYQTTLNEVQGRTLLTHVHKDDGTWTPALEVAPDMLSFWVAFGTSDDFDNDTLDFEEMVLHAGDVAMLVFTLDADGDGVFGWEEDHYGSSDDPGNDDYDGDGLTDDEEVNPQPLDPNDPNSPFLPAGWDVQVGDDPPYRAFSDPRLADGDEDGLTDLDEKLGQDGLPPDDPNDTGDATDPNKRDTDADGIDDADDLAPTVPAVRLHVKPDAPAGGDGLAWDTAFQELQDAIGEAATRNGNGDPTDDVAEIWVAAGDYTFTVTLPLLAHVGIYGGFVGGETKRAQRGPANAVIDGSDQTVGQAFYALSAHGAVLDGFMMSSWSLTEPNGGGAAIRIGYSDSVILRNLYFIDNTAQYGGAVCVIGCGDSGEVVLENCVFSGNGNPNAIPPAVQAGALYVATSSTVAIRNCRFLGNRALWRGGAIEVVGSSHLSASSCLFEANQAGNVDLEGCFGGAIAAYEESTLTLLSCRFLHNAALHPTAPICGGAVLFQAEAPLSVTNCLFWGNRCENTSTPGLYGFGSALWISSTEALLTNCTVVGNSALYMPDTYYGNPCAAIYKDNNPAGTLTLQNCVIAWNSWPDPTQAIYCCNLGYSGGQNPGGAAGQLFLDRTCLYPDLQDVAELSMGAYFPQLIVDEPGFPQGWDSSGNVRPDDGSLLIDFGNNYVDIDPTTPGIQFLPEFDLDGNLRIVDGDGDGLTTVDIGAFEYSPY